MTSPEAAGRRFIAAGEFLWMADIAQELRAALGDAAAKVPTRKLPDVAVRLPARFDPGVRAVAPYLGRRHPHTADKARRTLAWQPRPAAETVTDCARTPAAHQVV
ncbi:hypothetical protein ACFWFF_16940 [Streptomyces sp. NPDC060223]|uniref:hypothetical protein n=1 Tax=unclassified Streptomyces TaxID=2593676 RepID=UPI003627812F